MSLLDGFKGFAAGLRGQPFSPTPTTRPPINVAPGLDQLQVVDTSKVPTRAQIPGSWSRAWLGPGQPFSTMLGESDNIRDKDAELEPRTFQYVSSVNSTMSPRLAYGLLAFSDLRGYAESVPEVSMCLRLLTEEMKAFVPTITDLKDNKVMDSEYEWMTVRPDGFNPFPVWLSRFLYNTLIYDAGCAYMVRNSRHKIVASRVIDGSTMFVLVDERGEQPRPPAPAFQQIIWGTPRLMLNTRQLWYKPRHLRADAPYGRSPIEDSLPAVKLLQSLWDYEFQKYQVGNIPEMVFAAPENWKDNVDAILDFEAAFNARMSGSNQERVRARFMPAGTQALQTKELTFNEESYNSATNAVRMAFGILQSEVGEGPSAGLGGKGYAEAMQSAFYRMGLAPLISYVESHFNDIMHMNGETKRKFKMAFPPESLDPQKEEEKYSTRFQIGGITRDEYREGIGMQKMGGEEGAFLVSPGGAGGEEEGGDPFADMLGGGGGKKPGMINVGNSRNVQVRRPIKVAKHPVGVLNTPVAVAKFDENEPRDADGKWTSGGGGGKSQSTVKWKNRPRDKFNASYKSDEEAISGDNKARIWNQTGAHWSVKLTSNGESVDYQRFKDKNDAIKFAEEFLSKPKETAGKVATKNGANTLRQTLKYGKGSQDADFDNDIEETENGHEFRVRNWGNWQNPRDAENEEDYDWQELSENSRKVLDSVIDKFNANNPDLEVSYQTGEKNWIYFSVESKKANEKIAKFARPDIQQAKEIGDRLGVDWDVVDPDEFTAGLAEETEHAETVDNDVSTMAQIALDHLAEDPHYYSKLKDALSKFERVDLAKFCGVDPKDDMLFGSPVSEFVETDMPAQGANESKIVSIGGGAELDARPAVWKPASGEKEKLRQWIHGELYRRAEAAYLLDRELAPDEKHYLVPVAYTAEVEGEVGSVQHYVTGRQPRTEVTEYGSEWVEQAAVLDYIMGQVDRNRKNWLTHPHDDRRPVLIDSDLSFSPDPKQHLHSSFVDAMRDRPLTEKTLDSIYAALGNHDLWQDLQDVLEDEDAVAAAKERAQELYDNKRILISEPIKVVSGSGDEESSAPSTILVKSELPDEELPDEETIIDEPVLMKVDFEESKHPRANDGKFTSKGGEGTGGGSKAQEKEPAKAPPAKAPAAHNEVVAFSQPNPEVDNLPEVKQFRSKYYGDMRTKVNSAAEQAGVSRKTLDMASETYDESVERGMPPQTAFRDYMRSVKPELKAKVPAENITRLEAQIRVGDWRFVQNLNRGGGGGEKPKPQPKPEPKRELTYDEKYSWATNAVKSEFAKKLKSDELVSDVQTAIFNDDSEELFVSRFKEPPTDNPLPKAKKPSGDSNWMFHTEKDKMPPEIMYCLQQHFKEYGDSSAIVMPHEIIKHSNNMLDEKTLDGIYSKSLRPWFEWERNGGLNQLRLRSGFTFSEEGISTNQSAKLKALKESGFTPKQLYAEIQKLKPEPKELSGETY